MNGHLGADLVYHLRTACLSGFPQIYAGVRDALANPATADRVRRTLDLFRSTIRPLIPVARVYRHTPILPGLHPEGWCVVEYAAPDRSHAVVWLLRLAGDADPVHDMVPRGLSRADDDDYDVYLDNDEERFPISGRDLAARGIPIRLAAPLTSELVVLTRRGNA